MTGVVHGLEISTGRSQYQVGVRCNQVEWVISTGWLNGKFNRVISRTSFVVHGSVWQEGPPPRRAQTGDKDTRGELSFWNAKNSTGSLLTKLGNRWQCPFVTFVCGWQEHQSRLFRPRLVAEWTELLCRPQLPLFALDWLEVISHPILRWRAGNLTCILYEEVRTVAEQLFVSAYFVWTP